MGEAVALLERGATDFTPQTLTWKLKQTALPHSLFLHSPPLLLTIPPTKTTTRTHHRRSRRQPPAMSPFQDSHQPTHAGQPAGAFNFAPDDGPIASTFDGEGQAFDSTLSNAWMDQPGLWDTEFSLQSAFDLTLNQQAMLPSCHAEGDLFDFSMNNWTDEVLEFGTGSASQNALGPALNGTTPPFDAERSPFGSNPWMNQPIGTSDAEVASQSALSPLGQAAIASDGAPFHPQDASFDCFNPADWTNNNAVMPDALGGFADPVR
jgi:hypothetical protein